MIDQLGSASYTPEEITGLIEATGDPEQNIRLLALSSDWESTCADLSFAYSALGRCKEAKFVLETLISTYPENADCHLALGTLFCTESRRPIGVSKSCSLTAHTENVDYRVGQKKRAA